MSRLANAAPAVTTKAAPKTHHDCAIAPGSQTIRDKEVHTACGVFKPTPIGNTVRFDLENGFAPALPDPNPTPVRMCTNCQTVLQRDQPLVPASRAQLPGPEECPVCREQALEVIDAREPRDFFTDLDPQDYEGTFEWTPRSTRPTLTFERDPITVIECSNAVAGVLPECEILSVNDNGGERGFEFRPARVRPYRGGVNYDPIPNAYTALKDANDRVSPDGAAFCVALLSRRRTDSLLVDIKSWPAGVYADPTTVEGRAAWYSYAFFLRVAATQLLDSDNLELDAGFRTRPRDNRPSGQAFLCDKLENGAGYCTRLAEPDQFARLLAQCDPSVADSVAEKWLASSHSAECDTSCNLCLRDFYNMPYHGLLDWRLGLDMARLAAGGHVPDLVTPWQTGGPQNPWQRIVSVLPAILGRLDYDTDPPVYFGALRGFVRPHQDPTQTKILILRHPLWTDSHPDWQAAVLAVQQQHLGIQPIPINPFIAIRRPAEYA